MAKTQFPQDSKTSRRLFWEHHVSRWKRSGLSLSKYSQRHKINDRSLSVWKRKFEGVISEVERVAADESVSLIEVPEHCFHLSQHPADPSGSLVLHVGADRFQVDIPPDFSPTLLGKLVKTLERLIPPS